MNKKRVAVIGAGPSGLVAVKQALEEGFEVVCFEGSKDIGGLWNYDSRKGSASVYDSVVVNTSKQMLQFSDFPVPKDWPRFLPHKLVQKYLELYCENFGLRNHIKFGRRVDSILQQIVNGKETGKWEVVYRSFKSDKKHSNDLTPKEQARIRTQLRRKDSISFSFNQDNSSSSSNSSEELITDQRISVHKADIFDFVMICTGHHWKPNIPLFDGMNQFTGKVLHSQKYRVPYPFKDDRILVVGVGNSGIDIATELTPHAQKLVLSSRSGNWIAPKTTLFGLPTDHLSTRAANSIPRTLLNFGLETIVTAQHGSLNNFGLKPKHSYLEAPPVIGRQILEYIDAGKVQVKNDVRRFFDMKKVEFEDGTVEEFDTVIYCTGYKIENSFVDNSISGMDDNNSNRVRLYKHIFPSNCDGLAFIGLVQSTVSTLPVAEMQARWVSSIFAGKLEIPNQKERRDITDLDYIEHLKRFVPKDRTSIAVDHVEYMDMMAEQLKCRPDLYRLWKWNWGLAIKLTFGPAISSHYRLYGPGKWEGAENEITECCSHFDIMAIISSLTSSIK